MPKSSGMYRGITCKREARRLAVVNCLSASGKDHRRQPRGGLVPAALMARNGIRNVETLCISAMTTTTSASWWWWLLPPPQVTAKLAGGGRSGGHRRQFAKAIRELYPRAKFITIFAKPLGRPGG